MKTITVIFLLLIGIELSANTYYVAPSTATPAGNDANAGTIGAPWLTWGKAIASSSAGDIVYFRGGNYVMPDHIDITKNGSAGNPITFMNYSTEVPVFNFAALGSKYAGLNIGMEIYQHDYWTFKGLKFSNIGQIENNYEAYGIYMNGCNYIIFENCTVNDIGGHGFFTTNGDYIYFTNCDAYDCADVLDLVDPGNFATGFDWGVNLGDHLYIYGCRAYRCADDGFSGRSEGEVYIDRCWSWANGYLSHGGGTGFKPGPCDNDGALNYKITNCISAYNNTGTAGNGFSENNDSRGKPNALVYNNIAYKNKLGFYGGTANSNLENSNVYKNNISYGSTGGQGEVVFQIAYTHEYNTWDTPPGVSLSNADFITVDSAGISGARQSDGNLPIFTFLHIAGASDLIGAGIGVGLELDGDSLLRDPAVITLGAFDPNGDVITGDVYATVTTTGPSMLKSITATSGGNVTSDGGAAITARGIVWGTSANPTLSNNVISTTGTTGSYSITIPNLTSNTTYHVRSYATNSVGTSYGSDVEFTTPVFTGGSTSGKVGMTNGKLGIIK